MPSAILLLFASLLLATSAVAQREIRSLAGEWTVRLDPDGVGEAERWFAESLEGQPIALPGTTDLAGIGHELDTESMTYPVEFEDSRFPSFGPVTRADESGHLARTHLYIGKAWYQRTIRVPEGWAAKCVQLRLERVLWRSDVWVDERYFGSYDSLVTEHAYLLKRLEPGEHRLTVRVDNGPIHPIGIIGHAYGPETQSRWNGIVGALELVATPPTILSDLQAYPAPDRKSVSIHASTLGGSDEGGPVRLCCRLLDGETVIASAELAFQSTGGVDGHRLVLPIEQAVRGWDEFEPKTYTLVATLEGDEGTDELRRPLGFRTLRREGRHLTLDGRRLFLRGTLDCCVYPRTGHPPMTVPEWLEVLGTVREHGFNHVRFHSWCPPEAAFEAADRLGLYLQPETPFWVDNWTSEIGVKPKLLGFDEEVTRYVRIEIARIGRAYGDHPSFAFFCIGNEFGMSSDWELVDELVAEGKAIDPRHLCTGSTARKNVPSDDFWVTHAVHGTPARGFGKSYHDGTDWDFSLATEKADVPVVAHETGQRPVFPDYPTLLPKFTPHLRPLELERFRDRLTAAGLAGQVDDFVRASACFQDVQYKAEHEAFARTADLAGYQLLSLGDFTGQSEALVGIIDPFLESKGVVTAEEVRRWNAPTVVLARIASPILAEDPELLGHAHLIASVEVRHHGRRDLDEIAARWALTAKPEGRVLAEGGLPATTVPTGGLTRLGDIAARLPDVEQPTAAILRVELGQVANEWPFWIYPALDQEPEPDATTLVTDRLDDEAIAALERGEKVLLLAHGVDNDYAKRTPFASVYWSAGWWGNAFSQLGILCDPAHPALASFPNDGHSDWQWCELTEGATTFLLDGAPEGFRPIVQPVTDFHHNHLLGQLFEARVGKGRLLVCGYDLETKPYERLAARQLRRSLIDYLDSEEFRPEHELSLDWLTSRLARPEPAPVVEEAAVPTNRGEFHVLCAFRLEEKNVNRPWSPSYDQPLFLSSKPTWSVEGGCWVDDVGEAWHGNPLEVTIADLRPGAGGVLYAHFHDWNELGRRGKLELEGRSFVLGPHGGEGVWVALPVTAAELEDGRLVLRATPTAGPNLMVTECLFVRD